MLYSYIIYDIVFDINDIVHDIVYDSLPDVWYLKFSRADVLGRLPVIPCYLNGNSFNTFPQTFRGKIPMEATADSRPDSATIRLADLNQIGWLLYRIRYRTDMYDMTFNIERQCDLQYHKRYQHAIAKSVCLISKSWNLDIGDPVIDIQYQRLVTFNI
jgi:hypothetical protein